MKLGITFLLILKFGLLNCQIIYKIGDKVDDFTSEAILNYSKNSASLSELSREITILDFFGTWCVPCRRAIPELEEIQRKYPVNVRVLLLSVEENDKLKNFISTQKSFTLPLIVDSKSEISDRFDPPSYPYTIVINKNGYIIATPSYEQITDSSIKIWLNKTENNLQKPTSTKVVRAIVDDQPEKFVNKLAQEFVYAAKTNSDVTDLKNKLSALTLYQLRAELSTDEQKMTFWINVYNGYTQVLLKQNPDAYKHRGQFFSSKQISIAGEHFSLDLIEHGILRRSKIKWSFGYLGKPFPSRLEKSLRVKKLDPRIHFTLNCGANSCPPIAFYKTASMDAQLEIATKAFLSAEASFNKERNTVELPAILGWFRRDFGGKKGIRKLLREENIIAGRKPKIKFKKYDWQLHLDNYKN